MISNEVTNEGYYWFKFDNGWQIVYLKFFATDRETTLHFLAFNQTAWCPVPGDRLVQGPIQKPKF